MKNIVNLRVIFVQMLFALTVGQLALKAGDLFIYGHADFLKYHYAYLHQLLCIIILSTSWVGWQLSQATQNSEKINSVYSLQYLILLVDIFLVIAYFMIVRCVEINDDHTISPPDVSNTVLWTLIIFSVYSIWDILTKGPKLKYLKKENNYLKVTTFHFMPIIKRIWPTLLCFFISLYIYRNLTASESPLKGSIIYIILILLFLVFRGLKQEVKRVYKLQEDQVPDSLITQDMVFPISISETRFMLKYIIIKIVPLILLIGGFVIYYML